MRETTTLAHINRLVTERCNQVTREWIQDKVAESSVYKLKRKLGMRDAFNPKAKKKTGGKTTPKTKKDTSVFFQMASGHALIGTHLKRVKAEQHDWCGWCGKRERQSRGHLFGKCEKFEEEYHYLVEAANKIRVNTKKKQLRRSWRAHRFFEEEGYEDAVISYLKSTGIGYKVKLHDGEGGPIPERG